MPGETPKTRNYAQPRSDRFGIYRDLSAQMGGDSGYSGFLGPLDQGFMGRSPREAYLGMPNAEVTPQANPAAVRAYTRNAPYMEEFMSDPQAIVSELYQLQQRLKEDPKDVVSEYRTRVLRGALRDVFGMLAPDELDGLGLNRAQAPTTPQKDYTPPTPKYRY
jgi:hypothetical protein